MSLAPVQQAKLELMTHGMTVTPAARRALSGEDGRPLTLADYASTSGISLCLGEDVWVNAPIQDFNANFVNAPKYELDVEGEGYVMRGQGHEFPTHPLPVPDYHDQANRWGERYTSYAYTHTDRVRISPVEGCAMKDERLPAKHVLISGGTPRKSDYPYMHAVYEQVAKSFPGTDVDIMMVPMPGLLDPSWLDEIGIHQLSINLEMYNADLAKRVMPGKVGLGRDRYLDFIESAVEIMGPGRVRSLLMVGIESIDDTVAGVEALSQRGCEPVLSPFRPDPSTPMKDCLPPTVEYLREAYLRSAEAAEKHGRKLGPSCIPCMHNTLTFNDGSDFYHWH